MDWLAKMDRDELVRRMRHELEQTVLKVVDVVNDARDGHLINYSEEAVRDLMAEFRRRMYKTAAQMRVETTETSTDFSPSDPGVGLPRGGESIGAELQRRVSARLSRIIHPRGRRRGPDRPR
jgi:hypothetical protein